MECKFSAFTSHDTYGVRLHSNAALSLATALYSHHPYCRYVCIPSTTRCTSLSSLLFILIFIKSHIMFLHIQFVLHITVLLFCTFLYSIAHFTSYFFFYLYIYIYIYSCVVLLLYNLILILFFILFYFYSLHCPLSGPDLTYISLLIIPCIIYHVTNKETLNLEP